MIFPIIPPIKMLRPYLICNLAIDYLAYIITAFTPFGGGSYFATQFTRWVPVSPDAGYADRTTGENVPTHILIHGDITPFQR